MPSWPFSTQRFTADQSIRGGRQSALIPTATDPSSRCSAGQLLEVGSSDFLQRQAQLTRELGDIPKNVTKFEFE